MRYLLRISLAWIALLVLSAASSPYQAPPPPLGLQWTLPQRIPGYDDNADAPFMVVDQNRTVHAFNSVWMGKSLVVVYSQWTQAGGWTTPIDILISPWAQQARIVGAFLDQAGFVHVTFFGGNDLQAGFFYSKAPLVYAGRASSWTPLRLIGEYASTPTNGALTGDGNGNLYLVYSGNRDGIGLYATYSADGGDTWTEPVSVSLVNDDTHWPTSTSMTLDANGNLHAAWALVNERGTGDVIFYSQLNPERKEWSNPVLLAERTAGEYEVDWPSIVSFQDELIVIYDDSFPATRWMRRSSDGGRTWSDGVIPFNYIGEYGFSSFVVDSNGFLHMLLGNRTPSETHGMWHSVWMGDRWSDLEPLISGPRVDDGNLISRFDPSQPRTVISQGNTILVTWNTDPGAGRNGVWFAYTQLNAPELPVVPLPTPVPTPTPTPIAQILSSGPPDSSQVAAVLQVSATESKPRLQTPSMVLTVALVPVILLILAVIFMVRIRLKSIQ